MKTNNYTRKIRKEASKHGLTVNRINLEDSVATYRFFIRGELETQLTVDLDLNLEAYDGGYVKPLCDMANYMIGLQLKELNEQLVEEGFEPVEVKVVDPVTI